MVTMWLAKRTNERLSPQLRRFVDGYLFERRTILHFLGYATRTLPPGSRLLDAGAGDAPYRELFTDCHYITADFAATNYHDFVRHRPDIVCDLTAIPIQASRFDAVICTQVLEHVPQPQLVLREFRRILRPKGQLFLTVPLVGEIHEQPYDFYRYTPYSIERLCRQAGFIVEGIWPRAGAVGTLADLIHRTHLWLPSARSIGGRARNFLLDRLARRVIAPALAALDRYDPQPALTLGYACHCRVPSMPEGAVQRPSAGGGTQADMPAAAERDQHVL